MGVGSKEYKVLYQAIAEMGITDPDQIEKLIEQLNSFSNLLIDLFLERQKCEEASSTVESPQLNKQKKD